MDDDKRSAFDALALNSMGSYRRVFAGPRGNGTIGFRRVSPDGAALLCEEEYAALVLTSRMDNE